MTRPKPIARDRQARGCLDRGPCRCLACVEPVAQTGVLRCCEWPGHATLAVTPRTEADIYRTRLATRDLMQHLRFADPFRQGGGVAFGRVDRARLLQPLLRVMAGAGAGGG